jgi:methylenetetrahydrofolate--tRNA-(uracil-5-)-methyltransferase
MLGALCHYVTHAATRDFQPMKANFGILPPLPDRPGKMERGRYYAERALTAMRRFARDYGLRYDPHVVAAPEEIP